jgi:hypothetical protein
MSGGAKMFLSLIVLVILLGGGWYLFKGSSPAPVATTTETATTTPTTPTVPPPSLITSNDATDVGLQADMSTIDTQMGVVANDSASVDASLSDKPAQ